MDFPEFESTNQTLYNQNHQGNFGGDNEIQIENEEFNNNYNNFPNDNFNQNKDNDINYNNMEWNNVPSSDILYGQQDNTLDELELKRIDERKIEEEQRRAKIMKKMNDELRIKQEFRDKAREYIENWNTYIK